MCSVLLRHHHTCTAVRQEACDRLREHERACWYFGESKYKFACCTGHPCCCAAASPAGPASPPHPTACLLCCPCACSSVSARAACPSSLPNAGAHCRLLPAAAGHGEPGVHHFGISSTVAGKNVMSASTPPCLPNRLAEQKPHCLALAPAPAVARCSLIHICMCVILCPLKNSQPSTGGADRGPVD